LQCFGIRPFSSHQKAENVHVVSVQSFFFFKEKGEKRRRKKKKKKEKKKHSL